MTQRHSKADFVPIIGVPCDIREIDNSVIHATGMRYLKTIHEQMQAQIILIPCLIDGQEDTALDPILDRIDGIMLTGSNTNIHPSFYGEDETSDHPPFDRSRDLTVLKLIPKVIERDLPLLGICRGCQEINVACGGTLRAKIEPYHYKLDTNDRDSAFAPRHQIDFTDGGIFSRISKGTKSAIVNSLHEQGIERIGACLNIEATESTTGLVEAISVKDARFAVGVQWHPEYQSHKNTTSDVLYGAFAKALNTR